jgi:hypothetical protein
MNDLLRAAELSRIPDSHAPSTSAAGVGTFVAKAELLARDGLLPERELVV